MCPNGLAGAVRRGNISWCYFAADQKKSRNASAKKEAAVR